MFLTYDKRRSGFRAAFLFLSILGPALAQSDQLAEQSRHGKELMSQGRFEEAATVYQQMVKELPGNPGLLLNLGLAEEMSGHPDRAIPRFEGVLKSQPGSIPALTSLAMSHLQLNQPAAAIPPLEKLLALDAKNLNSRGMLAGAELSLDRFQEAAAQYRQLTKLAPSDPKAWYGLGKAYEGLASQSFDRLSKLDNQSGYVALLLAEARVQQRQFRSAFFFYREAEKKAPDVPGLYSGLAQVYRNTGHADWAVIEQEREATLDTRSCQSQTSPACLFTQGKFLAAAGTNQSGAPALFWKTRAYNALAIQSFDQLSRLPESVELHALKAQTLHDHRQDLEASREWKAALALSPGSNDPRLKSELATSLFAARDYQSAIPALQELLRSDPQSPNINFMLGECLSRTQQAEQALTYLNTALQKRPNLLPAHASLGLALASLGKNGEAIPHLEKAAALDDDGSLHYSLARAYQAEGQTGKAKLNLDTYKSIQQKNADANGTVASESEITAPAH